VVIMHFTKEIRHVENVDIQIQRLENTIGLNDELLDVKDKT